MNKYITTYTLNNTTYPSEIFTDNITKPSDIITLRHLPDEIIKHHTMPSEDELMKESMAYYIDKDHYVDAVHRFLYLTTIKGLDETFMVHVQDDGLLHRLVHNKVKRTTHEKQQLIIEANEFEQQVPGSYLWAYKTK